MPRKKVSSAGFLDGLGTGAFPDDKGQDEQNQASEHIALVMFNFVAQGFQIAEFGAGPVAEAHE